MTGPATPGPRSHSAASSASDRASTELIGTHAARLARPLDDHGAAAVAGCRAHVLRELEEAVPDHREAAFAPPAGSTTSLGMLAHVTRLLLAWKLTGKTWPHPFLDRATRGPARPLTVLSTEEREALRPRCGPRAG